MASPYQFELEVYRLDRPACTMTHRERVLSKVEGTLFLESNSIPVCAEVPIRVTGPNEEDIGLGWDGHLAISDQAARAYHLRIQHNYEAQALEA